MMKFTLSFLILLATLKASSQSDVTKVFEISPTLYDRGTKVLPNGDGYAVFGYRGGSTASNGDIFLLRLDKDGNEMGRHIYGLPNKTECISSGVVAVGNNGWLVAGWQAQATVTSKLGYLVRVDANGNELWSKTLSGPNLSGLNFTSLASLPSGGFIAAGVIGTDLSLVRLTANGDIVWKKSYNAEVPSGIYVNESGGNCFVISGNKVLKIRTSEGNLAWMKGIELPVFGAPDGDINVGLEDIVPTGNGTFAITGTALNDQVFNFEQAPYASLWKENGDIIWTRAFPANPATKLGGGTCNSILHLSNQNNLMLTGEDAEGGINVTRIGINGELLEVSNIPTPALSISTVLLKHQGRYVITGGCFTNGMNTLFYRSAGNWLPMGNNRAGNRSGSTLPSFSIFPNPANTTINLQYWSEVPMEVQFQIFNASQQIAMESIHLATTGINSANFNIQSLPQGIYWLKAPQIGLCAKSWVKY
ncbi:MAG: T9SS type A sorting domain-containing protein [Saprospiraceae bacterium]